MNQDLYSMRDKLSGWSPAIPMPNEEIAKRYFKEQHNYSLTVKTSPKDFELYRVGTFDTETGVIKGLEPSQFELIVKGEEYEV